MEPFRFAPCSSDMAEKKKVNQRTGAGKENRPPHAPDQDPASDERKRKSSSAPSPGFSQLRNPKGRTKERSTRGRS